MRVTQTMLSNNNLSYISQGYDRLGKIYDQINSGKKITRPSQDPVVAMNGIRYRTEVQEVGQYKRNLGEVYSWMENADAVMDKTTSALQRIRELAVEVSNDTYNADQRKSAAAEIAQLQEHLESLGNTKVNNKYIFNGSETLTKPIDLASNTFSTNSEKVEIEVSKGITLAVNTEPQNVFPKGLFDEVSSLLTTLQDPTTSGSDVGAFISKIDNRINTTLAERSELGARLNRAEMIEDRLSQHEIIANKTMSDNEDIDFEEVIIDLNLQQNIHNAALAAGAKIIQPTLMDFLR
ncbi:flagellar hook-associated protein FlgL [Schinkia sp. CFF1]